MADTAVVIADLPAGGTVAGTDLLEVQRGTGAGSSLKVTGAAVAEAAADALVAGSGIAKAKAGGVTTLESAGAAINSITTTTATLALTDANRTITCSNASAQTITIPQQSSVAWAGGAQIEFVQTGAGAVTIVAGAGVTLRRNASLGAASGGTYAVFAIKRIAINEWVVFGQLAAA